MWRIGPPACDRDATVVPASRSRIEERSAGKESRHPKLVGLSAIAMLAAALGRADLAKAEIESSLAARPQGRSGWKETCHQCKQLGTLAALAHSSRLDLELRALKQFQNDPSPRRGMLEDVAVVHLFAGSIVGAEAIVTLFFKTTLTVSSHDVGIPSATST
jgi:hypothetical protein